LQHRAGSVTDRNHHQRVIVDKALAMLATEGAFWGAVTTPVTVSEWEEFAARESLAS